MPAIRAVAGRNQALSRQVGQVLDSGRPVLTLGNAAWLAAHSGRLSGRQVCLPWFYVAGFERDFPDIGFTPGQAVSEDGLWISGAMPAHVSDLAVTLVRHTLGPALAIGAADEGHLRVGARADVAILPVSLDELLAGEVDFGALRSDPTIVDGRIQE